MGLNAKKAGNGSNNNSIPQPSLEQGTYPSRLVQIIDLGLQPQRPYEGKEKPPINEIMLTYELVDVFMVDENGEELKDKPRWVSETIPFHNLNAERAKSTQRYNALDPNGDFEGDFSKTIDTPVNLTIIVNKKGDKEYVNVAGISPMRKVDAAKCPPLVNDPRVFSLDDPDVELLQRMPEWLQEKIKSNLQFKGSKLQKLLSGVKEEDKKEEKKDVGEEEDAPW